METHFNPKIPLNQLENKKLDQIKKINLQYSFVAR
jgi:hypothetical protein